MHYAPEEDKIWQRSRIVNWRRRFPQWLEVLKIEQRSAGRLPWLTMVRALLTGVVPRAVWRQRMRVCMRCELFSTVHGKTGKLYMCKSTHPDLLGVGCGCAVNISALSANPYGYGCYGRMLYPDLGWGPHFWKGRWDRLKSVIDFVRRR